VTPASLSSTPLLRDRDDKFGPGFDVVWESEGASIVRSPVRAPNANAVAERWIRTVRSGCTDRLLILNEQRLGRVLVRYVRHSDGHRPHRALGLRPPDPLIARIPPTPAELASVCRREILGALINEYHAT